jgi:hypothetical protein
MEQAPLEDWPALSAWERAHAGAGAKEAEELLLSLVLVGDAASSPWRVEDAQAAGAGAVRGEAEAEEAAGRGGGGGDDETVPHTALAPSPAMPAALPLRVAAAAPLRCLDGTHPRGCAACTPPPCDADARLFVLHGGERGAPPAAASFVRRCQRYGAMAMTCVRG